MEGRRQNLLLGDDVVLLALGGQLALGLVTMALALAVLLVGVFDRDGLAKQVLAVHGSDSGVTGLERVEADEAIALGDVVLVAHNVWLAKDLAELGKRVVKNLLVDLGIEVVDEQLGANVDRLLLVGAGLVYADGLAPDSDAVEDLGGILGGGGGIKLDEAVALVCLRYAILGHVYLANRADLCHELREQLLRETLVDVAHIDGGIFILLPECVNLIVMALNKRGLTNVLTFFQQSRMSGQVDAFAC